MTPRDAMGTNSPKLGQIKKNYYIFFQKKKREKKNEKGEKREKAFPRRQIEIERLFCWQG